MTVRELGEILRRQPEIADLLVAYIEAKESNPKEVERAMPIILKIMHDMRKMKETGASDF